MHRLFKISLGNSFSSYKTLLIKPKSPVAQIDAAFNFFEKNFYIVETKWTAKPTIPKDIVLFRDRLSTVGTIGLFISVSGFTSQAVEKAYEFRKERQILLMDGEELEIILKGSPPFDEAMRLKQMYLLKDSNPYYKIQSTIQMEAHVYG